PLLPLKQAAYIKASNAEAYDHFGCGGANQGHTGNAIAVSGDGNTMAIGAPFESGGAKGINGNQNDHSTYAAGAVYVFTRQGDAPGDGDQFGYSLALSGDGNTLAVGAPTEDSAAKEINGNQSDDSALSAGAVYVFTRTGSAWAQQAYVKNANQDPGDLFGF